MCTYSGLRTPSQHSAPDLRSRRRPSSSPGEGAQVRSDTQEQSHYDGELRMRRGGCGPHYPGTLACPAPPNAPESLSSEALIPGPPVGCGAVCALGSES